jgi:hypothetical protein
MTPPYSHSHDHSHDHSHGRSHDDSHDHSHTSGEPHEGTGAPPAAPPRVLPAPALQALHEAQARTREQQRELLAGLTHEELQDLYEQNWKIRTDSSNAIVTASEELLARAVTAELPAAAMVVLYEDTSHDAPHGHVHSVLDITGDVLISGTSDAWHDAEWTEEVDEFVWDIHQLDRAGFRTEGSMRVRRIPIR